ncbi:hypothetical protein QBC42DRAFT_270944 [Cladorrhinum samala]|uniref:DUF1754-domain-containing protein n=1 Tax=Cladorrhinum samala TaxID=585594 RepID=A0AAV9HJQ3_9PEZI|nr:hypothetical protein QBC42DRAFT_270944 [Cladorrhinum samala]
MGNLCGKQSTDPFDQPGRRLDSAPAPNASASASVPASARQQSQHQKSPKVGGPPRTLGGSSSSPSSSADDARRKAAEAAEARFQKSKGGKLKAQLDKERGKTRIDTLKDASESERRHRDVDQSVGALRNA